MSTTQQLCKNTKTCITMHNDLNYTGVENKNMVKLLVISDSHGNTSLAEKVLKKHEDVDMVIHLGDYFRDANRLEELFPQLHFLLCIW